MIFRACGKCASHADKVLYGVLKHDFELFRAPSVRQTLQECVKTSPRVVFGSTYAAEVEPTPTERGERRKLRFHLKSPPGTASQLYGDTIEIQ